MKALRSPRIRGFTLIEIMVVITILGILAALIVPRVVGRTDDARIAAAQQDIASVMQALKLYRLDNGRYPTTEQGLQALISKPAARTRADELETGWVSSSGAMCQRIPWGHRTVPEPRPARRDRRLQLRRRRPGRRSEHRRRHRLLVALARGGLPAAGDADCAEPTIPMMIRTAGCVDRRRRVSGFTLLEMLVVIVLAGILVSIVHDQRDARSAAEAHARGERIGQLMSLAADEARIRQLPIVWEADLRGYRFVAEVSGERKLLTGDDLLRERSWETPLTRLSVQDGAGPQPAQVLLGAGRTAGAHGDRAGMGAATLAT